jgi:predicted amidohydrolase YtcJ
LEPGKLADLTIATAPLLSIAPEDLKKVKTRLTMIGGKVVFEDEAIVHS